MIVSTIQANINLSRRGYMIAPEEYILLLHIRMQFKVLNVLYSYKSQ